MCPLILRAAAVALLPALLTACSTTPRFDQHFGHSVGDMQKAQTLYPAASNNAAVPAGMDGKTAKFSYDQYQKSFKTPEPKTNVFTIGVGR